MPPNIQEEIVTTTDRKLVSFVVPVLNEEQNILRLYEVVCAIMSPLAHQYAWEIVFTDNHSTDGTREILRDLASRDKNVHVLRFSRNFGYQRSILTGYRHARGDAVIQLDCDLQDPPDLIPTFLAKWTQGYHVVYGVRRTRQEGLAITQMRQLFYWMIQILSEDDLPKDAGDFRLVDRRIITELRHVNDSTPYLRGIIAALGFNQIGVAYDREARIKGESKFHLRHLIGLAIDGILNHSLVPLRVSTIVGMGTLAFALLLAAMYLALWFSGGEKWPPGFATLAFLVLLSISLNGLSFGIMGEYVGRTYRQVKQGPLTIIEEEFNPSEVSRQNVA